MFVLSVPCLQLDINEVNKIAHELKNRLERLHKMNEASLSRKVRQYCLFPASDMSYVVAVLVSPFLPACHLVSSLSSFLIPPPAPPLSPPPCCPTLLPSCLYVHAHSPTTYLCCEVSHNSLQAVSCVVLPAHFNAVPIVAKRYLQCQTVATPVVAKHLVPSDPSIMLCRVLKQEQQMQEPGPP